MRPTDGCDIRRTPHAPTPTLPLWQDPAPNAAVRAENQGQPSRILAIRAVPNHRLQLLRLHPVHQLHQNLPELALIEGNLQVATKSDESLSPSLFTFHSHFAPSLQACLLTNNGIPPPACRVAPCRL
jgi:hypothetical protein